MAKFIFQISKFNAVKNTLRCKERYNSRRDSVTALATLHLGQHFFLNGMHYAYQDSEGDITYSFDKKEAAKDVKVDITANFDTKQLDSLREQIAELGAILTKPITDDNGVSQLQGYQLHLVIDDSELSYHQEEDDFGKKLVYKILPYQIKKVFICTASDEAYIAHPGTAKIEADLAIKAIYETRKVEESVKPTTVEEASVVLLDFSRARSRGAARKAKKEALLVLGAKLQANNAATAVSAVTSTNQILIVEDDEDDKPE